LCAIVSSNRNLREINFEHCLVNSNVIETIATSCHKLHKIIISNCRINHNDIYTLVSKCQMLRYISLNDCDSLTREAIECVLTWCKYLEFISFSSKLIDSEFSRWVFRKFNVTG
jgi:hypothetical protein